MVSCPTVPKPASSATGSVDVVPSAPTMTRSSAPTAAPLPTNSSPSKTTSGRVPRPPGTRSSDPLNHPSGIGTTACGGQLRIVGSVVEGEAELASAACRIGWIGQPRLRRGRRVRSIRLHLRSECVERDQPLRSRHPSAGQHDLRTRAANDARRHRTPDAPSSACGRNRGAYTTQPRPSPRAPRQGSE